MELGKNKVNLGNNKLCFLLHFSIDCDFLQADPWVGSLEPLIVSEDGAICLSFWSVNIINPYFHTYDYIWKLNGFRLKWRKFELSRVNGWVLAASAHSYKIKVGGGSRYSYLKNKKNPMTKELRFLNMIYCLVTGWLLSLVEPHNYVTLNVSLRCTFTLNSVSE